MVLKILHIRTMAVPMAKLLTVLLVFSTSGCEPLRKKFTRQKKKDASQSSQFIPVLDPIDYPDKVESPEESYRHYFSLWQVWDKELVMRIQEHASDKKINFTFNQFLVQLTEMEKLLSGEKRQKLNEYIAQLSGLQKDLGQPAGVRNDSVIQRKIERIGKNLREGFRFKDVQESLVK